MILRSLTISATLITLIYNFCSAQELTAKEIIQRLNDLMTQPTVISLSKMTITTSSGKLRTFTMKSFIAEKGEKNLIKYLSPKRVKGQTLMMLNNSDDIWIYFPRTNRVRKLATHAKKQKMQGSDFSYEDMGSGDAWLNEFETVRLKDEKIDGVDCYKLELTRRPESNSGYSRLIMWIDKSNFLAVRIDYFDDEDPGLHIKRLLLSDVKDIEGIPTATKMTMINIQDNTRTTLEYLEITYNAELPDDMFTERGMKRR